ncbi:MAG: hypothetical protein PHW73_15210 [Atribacterota bacterium]|nr:hypothetical protein [Atribacterota bacterium]
MKKVKVFLKDLFSLVANVRQLERDVENLENKVLAPENINMQRTRWLNEAMFYWSSPYWEETKPRRMTLEEKVDAIAKALKINFEWTEEQEKELVAKISIKKGIK